MSRVDYSELEGTSVQDLAARYRRAEPFPHLVLTDMLGGDAEELVSNFPDHRWAGWASRTSEYQPGKWSCRDIDVMPPLMRDLILELSGPHFLRTLSAITSIDNLIPDPFLEGGGLQYSESGGKLLPHTDFHFHPTLRLFRRVNLLLYLNPDWQPADGGELLLFKMGDDEPAVVVPPCFGTCAIFTTDHRSVHGVNPLSGSTQRRSIALYYYTVETTEIFSGDRRTYWYPPAKSVKGDAVSRARIKAMQSALGASRLMTRLAYRIDPQKPDLV